LLWVESPAGILLVNGLRERFGPLATLAFPELSARKFSNKFFETK